MLIPAELLETSAPGSERRVGRGGRTLPTDVDIGGFGFARG